MKGIIATICFTVLTLVGCVADRTDSATQDQGDKARVEQAVSSTLAHQVVPGVDVRSGSMDQLNLTGGGAPPDEGLIVCVIDGSCAACCGSSGVCCGACTGGPTVCTFP
jgi:hypothetical protein